MSIEIQLEIVARGYVPGLRRLGRARGPSSKSETPALPRMPVPAGRGSPRGGRLVLSEAPRHRGRLGRVSRGAVGTPGHPPLDGPARGEASPRSGPGQRRRRSAPSTSGPRSSIRSGSSATSTSPWSGRSRRSRATTLIAFLEALRRAGRQLVRRGPGLRGQVPDLAPPQPAPASPRPRFALAFAPAQARGRGRRASAATPSCSSRRSARGAGSWPRSTTTTPWRRSSSTRTCSGRLPRRRSISRSSSASRAGTSGPSSSAAKRSLRHLPRVRPLDHQYGPGRSGPELSASRPSCATSADGRRRPSAEGFWPSISSRRRDGLAVNEINHTMEFRNSEEPDRRRHLRGDRATIRLGRVARGPSRDMEVPARFGSRSSAARDTPAGSCSASSSGIPACESPQVTSRRFAGPPVARPPSQPPRPDGPRRSSGPRRVGPCDLLVPGPAERRVHESTWTVWTAKAGADHRPGRRLPAGRRAAWKTWYGTDHARPGASGPFVYGVPEINADEIRRRARCVAGPGCEAIVSHPGALSPGQSAASSSPARSSSTPRWGARRPGARPPSPPIIPSGRASSAPTSRPATATPPRSAGSWPGGRRRPALHISATAIEMVRGILVTIHAFVERPGARREGRLAGLPRRPTRAGPSSASSSRPRASTATPSRRSSQGTNYLRDRVRKGSPGRTAWSSWARSTTWSRGRPATPSSA